MKRLIRKNPGLPEVFFSRKKTHGSSQHKSRNQNETQDFVSVSAKTATYVSEEASETFPCSSNFCYFFNLTLLHFKLEKLCRGFLGAGSRRAGVKFVNELDAPPPSKCSMQTNAKTEGQENDNPTFAASPTTTNLLFNTQEAPPPPRTQPIVGPPMDETVYGRFKKIFRCFTPESIVRPLAWDLPWG